MEKNIVFTIPGLYNSGPDHWQTHWENSYHFTRINQQDWEKPVCRNWIRIIEDTVNKYPLKQVILIGHSLGCCTIVKWAYRYSHIIKGALLVGPSDTEAPNYPIGTTGFTPMPLNKLPFPSIVIASNNDEYVSLERATLFANHWGSELINAGPLGHINSNSNLGTWPEGYRQLLKLLQ